MAFQSFVRRMAVSCVCAALLAAAGCGGETTTGDIDKVGIAVSRFDVTVTNTSGRALVDLKVEIIPVGHATSFSTRIPRLENGEKRSIGFTLFSDNSAIQFSPRTAKPHAVAVTAKDIEGKEIHAEVPWKQ